MSAYETTVYVPDVRPYDRPLVWLLSFVGNALLPVIESGLVDRFWFTGYGGIGFNKHAKFRFETSDQPKAADCLGSSLTALGISPTLIQSYDVAGDIGKGEKSRFLGTNAKHRDPKRRGELAFTFLHASANLLLDCMVGPDTDGYWTLEEDKASGFNRESPLEQFHHLFCNMTQVPTFVCIGKSPTGQLAPLTLMEAVQRSGWAFDCLRKAQF